MKAPKNMGVSIRERLTQRARERRENAQLLMTRYAIERALYRLTQFTAIESVHVASNIEHLQKARSAPTAKLRRAALKHLFDWLVIGQIMPTNASTRTTQLYDRSAEEVSLDEVERVII